MHFMSSIESKYIIQRSPSITDTTGTKDFVLYSKVSFAQGVIVDHIPLTIVASYAGARLWTMKLMMIYCLLALRQESRTYTSAILQL